jgi:hypothetical protein
VGVSSLSVSYRDRRQNPNEKEGEMRRAKKEKRCVCGQLMPHPPVPPGTPWTWSKSPSAVPAHVVAAGHYAHEPDEYCCCAICLSMR